MIKNVKTCAATFTYNDTAYLESAANPQNGTVNYIYYANGNVGHQD